MDAADPILSRFRAEMRALYGARLERLVLFGSRARGDAKAGSDGTEAILNARPRIDRKVRAADPSRSIAHHKPQLGREHDAGIDFRQRQRDADLRHVDDGL